MADKKLVYRALTPEGGIIGKPCDTLTEALEIARSVWDFRGATHQENHMWTTEIVSAKKGDL